MNDTPRQPPSDSALYDEILARRWFYDFDLPNGCQTRSYLPEAVAPIHQTRLEMLYKVLTPVVQEGWSERRRTHGPRESPCRPRPTR